MSEGARTLTGSTLSCLLLLAMSSGARAVDDPAVEREIFRHSFLTSHCGSCHGGNDQKAAVVPQYIPRAGECAELTSEALVIQMMDNARDGILFTGIDRASMHACRFQTVMTCCCHVLHHRC